MANQIQEMTHLENFQISPHITCGEIWNYSTCGEISEFSTPVMWRHLKLLHMWKNFRLIHICHAQKFEISPHDNYFSPRIYPWDPWQISGMSMILGEDSLLSASLNVNVNWDRNGNDTVNGDGNLNVNSNEINTWSEDSHLLSASVIAIDSAFTFGPCTNTANDWRAIMLHKTLYCFTTSNNYS